MNSIHKINAINERELQNNVGDDASWHTDYADTPYIYIGNLHEKLQEHDIVVIFSQYGNPTHVNLVKDKESGKSRGFCYLKYEDHRSCVLAVDNFNGVLVYERPLKVDHTYYRLMPGQNEDDFLVEYPKLEAIEDVPKVSLPKLLESADPDNFDDPLITFKRPTSPDHERRKRRHTSKERSEKTLSHRSHRHDKSLSHRSHKSSHRSSHRSSDPSSKSHRSKTLSHKSTS